jgi:hypothetical protein
VLITVITDHRGVSVPMNPFTSTALFTLLLSFRVCLAAGPLVLPDTLPALSTNPLMHALAPTQLSNVSITLNTLSNFTSMTDLGGFG